MLRRTIAARTVVTLGLITVLGVGSAQTQGPAAWQWPVSTPEEQGLDPRVLADVADLIHKSDILPWLHYLVVIRNGHLVLERYFNGWRADRLHTLQSVSKSFASALVGIAIARGEFKGVDEEVLAFFPEANGIANLDERKAAMRLRDILTMRTGTDYHESGPDSPHFQLNRLATGWDRFYLDRPMIAAPGATFRYDSGGVILLSAMLKARTGTHAEEYAARHLFKPLGIEKWFWIHNAEGHSHTGGGLNLTARDVAKLGQLYLNKGRWGTDQVVPEKWVEESLKMHVDLTVEGQPPSGYGYLWWVWAPDYRGKTGDHVFAARGRGGQYVIVVPEYDMVVALGGDAKTGEASGQAISVFYDRILPAVRR